MASTTIISPCINPNLSNNPRDEFSLYFSLIREGFPLEIGSTAPNLSSLKVSSGRKRNDDGEIDIFGAEKYFSGGMDCKSELKMTERSGKKVLVKEGEAGGKPRSGTGSTCSESSGNSQSILLRDRNRFPPPPTKQNHNRGKGFLGVFRCSCSRTNSADVGRDGDSSSINSRRIDRFGDRGGEFRQKEVKREKEPPFPNSNLVAGKVTVGSDFGHPFLLKDDLGSSRLENLGLLNSAAAATATATATCGGGEREDDTGSESSSDLFEIESLSINSHPFSRTEATESSTTTTCYEPSEASIEWSVVTASAADFSVASEYNNHPIARSARSGGEARKPSRQQHRQGLLLGCVSKKAVETTAAGFDRREGLRKESSLPPAGRYRPRAAG